MNISRNSFSFSGPELFESPNLLEQFRFPKSKKKRIRAKWAKRSCNWRPSSKIISMDGGRKLICHPELIDKIRKQLAEDMANQVSNQVVSAATKLPKDQCPTSFAPTSSDLTMFGFRDYLDFKRFLSSCAASKQSSLPPQSNQEPCFGWSSLLPLPIYGLELSDQQYSSDAWQEVLPH